jgi:hypothetical protein
MAHHPAHLVVSISAHGFGHVAQTAPVLNHLHRLLPGVRITLRSGVPLGHLRSRIHAPFEHLQSEGDIGMKMASAVDVLAEESREAYRAFHGSWNQRVEDEARLLRDLKADFVLSNIGYLALGGAQRAGIGNAGMCSLNWYDIYRHYCGDDAVAAQIRDCYAQADAFLRIEPGLAMGDFANLVPIGPIAAVGENRREELRRYLKLSDEDKLVLVSLGGIASRLPMESWPHMEGVRWLVQEAWQVKHPQAVSIESLPLGFSDLLASCDALICKPGYGSFVEAAYSGVPVIYSSRDDWPETQALSGWLKRHGACREVSRDALERGDVLAPLSELWRAPCPRAAAPQGIIQAAEFIAQRLGS